MGLLELAVAATAEQMDSQGSAVAGGMETFVEGRVTSVVEGTEKSASASSLQFAGVVRSQSVALE